MNKRLNYSLHQLRLVKIGSWTHQLFIPECWPRRYSSMLCGVKCEWAVVSTELWNHITTKAGMIEGHQKTKREITFRVIGCISVRTGQPLVLIPYHRQWSTLYKGSQWTLSSKWPDVHWKTHTPLPEFPPPLDWKVVIFLRKLVCKVGILVLLFQFWFRTEMTWPVYENVPWKWMEWILPCRAPSDTVYH